jgi:hypothetical protein
MHFSYPALGKRPIIFPIHDFGFLGNIGAFGRGDEYFSERNVHIHQFLGVLSGYPANTCVRFDWSENRNRETRNVRKYLFCIIDTEFTKIISACTLVPTALESNSIRPGMDACLRT